MFIVHADIKTCAYICRNGGGGKLPMYLPKPNENQNGNLDRPDGDVHWA